MLLKPVPDSAWDGADRSVRGWPGEGDGMLTAQEQTDLLRLGYHWTDHYSISVTDGTWIARPAIAPADLITADTAMELSEKLQADYAERHPVSDGYLHERMST
jgi:hypothetical protein